MYTRARVCVCVSWGVVSINDTRAKIVRADARTVDLVNRSRGFNAAMMVPVKRSFVVLWLGLLFLFFLGSLLDSEVVVF